MGIDWVPARPRASTPPGELSALIAAQAHLVRHALDDLPDPPTAPVDNLVDRLDIPVDAGGLWPCYRVAAIGATALFPPEWRREAYTTMLPADAVAAVARWRWWYDAVGAGAMRHYLRRVATWDARLDTCAAQADLLRLAGEARAGRPPSDRLNTALTAVESLPDVPPVPHPGPPPPAPADDVPLAGQEAARHALAGHAATVDAAVRAFNRAVPRRLRAAHVPRIPDAHARQPFTEGFFAWVAPYLADGYGLYLWH